MLRLIETSDGSHTIKNEELNETYHSINGAIQESEHVYIRHGLHYYLEKKKPESIRILEVGFGTGLNALLTCVDEQAYGTPKIYDAIDAFPLSLELTEQLNYPACLKKEEAKNLLSKMHKAPWGHAVLLMQGFTLHKINSEIQSTLLGSECYDIVFFDAFAPSKQPEIWSTEVFFSIKEAMKKEGLLVTYCASGQFKRDLKGLNMNVESLPGPPGKLEMVRATRTS